jgi:uncharacterized protein YjiK
MRFFFASLLFSYISVSAQTNQSNNFIVKQLLLPNALQQQVCISGMTYMDNKLFLASERCPLVLRMDTSVNAVDTTINTKIAQEFEMEGITTYRGNLYLISESIVGIYRLNAKDGSLISIPTSTPLPQKLKSGDGMEGIAANELKNKFYLLRERNEKGTASQVLTYKIEQAPTGLISLIYLATTELPLENTDWRYSDICYDSTNARLLCLKSYSKGKTRKHLIDAIAIDADGYIKAETIKTIVAEGFSAITSEGKNNRISLNFEGITLDQQGNIYIISDNTSGQADCNAAAKEKTVLLKLVKN